MSLQDRSMSSSSFTPAFQKVTEMATDGPRRGLEPSVLGESAPSQALPFVVFALSSGTSPSGAPAPRDAVTVEKSAIAHRQLAATGHCIRITIVASRAGIPPIPAWKVAPGPPVVREPPSSFEVRGGVHSPVVAGRLASGCQAPADVQTGRPPPETPGVGVPLPDAPGVRQTVRPALGVSSRRPPSRRRRGPSSSVPSVC